jgi:hypothetical protein
LLENYISTHGKRPSPQNGRAFISGNIEKELWGMEKTFQYHQQIFAGLELEIYNDLLKKDKIFLQCGIENIIENLHTKNMGVMRFLNPILTNQGCILPCLV